MRILLVRPRGRKLYQTSGPDPGLGFLTTSLKANGHDVRICDLHRSPDLRIPFSAALRHGSFDVVGFKCFSSDAQEVGEYLEITSSLPGPRPITVAGGPLTTGMGSLSFQLFPSLDYAFVGEAEVGMPQLLEKLAAQAALPGGLKDVPGLVYGSDGEVRVNPQHYPEPLDALGFPDWGDMPPEAYPVDYAGARYVPVVTSRGCPFHCSYCAARLMNGARLRCHSPAYVIELLSKLKRDFDLREFCIVDDNFTFDKKHATEVCTALVESGLGLSWRATNGVRLETLDEDLVVLMERSGCRQVYVGVESGSQRILSHMGRKTSIETIVEKISLIRRSTRLSIVGFFIIGHPEEGVRDLMSSIGLARRLPLDMATFSYFTPHPGTEIFRHLKGGLPGPTLWRMHSYDRVSKVPRRLSPGMLALLQRFAYVSFFLRPRQVGILLSHMTRREPALRLLGRIAGILLNR